MKRVYLRTRMDKAWPGSWFLTQNHLGWHTIAQTIKQGAAYTYAKQCPKFTKKTVDRTCANSNTAQVEVQNGDGFAKLQWAWTKMLNRDQIYLRIANMEQTWRVQFVVVWGMWDFNSLNLWRWCIMGLALPEMLPLPAPFVLQPWKKLPHQQIQLLSINHIWHILHNFHLYNSLHI